MARKTLLLLIVVTALLITNCKALRYNYVPDDYSKGIYQRRWCILGKTRNHKEANC